jgi:arylsulfatase A-like enzyme
MIQFALLAVLLVDVMAAQEAPVQPNIVLIVSDDAGWSDFGFQGSTDVPTPNLDALRADGVRFERSYVTASVCSPSRAGLLSGRYQQRFGHENNMKVGSKWGMPGTERTLADRLHSAGYATAAVGKWHLGYEQQMRPLQQGFDRFHGQLAGSRSYTPWPNDTKKAHYRQRDGDELVMNEAERFDWVTEYFGDTAAGLVRELAPSKPYFLYIAFTAPHTPMQAPPEDLDALDGEPSKRKTYRAMQRAMDRAVGDIVAAVDASGEAGKTIIWFVNDNGGATTNASDNGVLRGMKGSAFEGGVRVPMVLRWPGLAEPGSTFSGPVSTLDIGATVIEAAKGDAVGLDGVDLKPFLAGADTADPHKNLFWRRGPIAAVLEGRRWKLIRVGDAQILLYDLIQDPSEQTDVASGHADVVERLSAALVQWESGLTEPRWTADRKWLDNQIKKHQSDIDTREKERQLP